MAPDAMVVAAGYAAAVAERLQPCHDGQAM